VNPFTKKVGTSYTIDPADVDPSIPLVVPGDEVGEHADFEDDDDDDDDDHFAEVGEASLRDAWAPPGLRKLPRVQIRDLFTWDIDDMFEIIAGRLAPPPGRRHKGDNFLSMGDADPGAETRPIRFGIRHTIYALPTAAIALLASLTTEDLPALGASMSDGKFFSERGWSADTCARIIGELRAVALEAQRPGRRLCLLMETPQPAPQSGSVTPASRSNWSVFISCAKYR
jgi:hypothetical protein